MHSNQLIALSRWSSQQDENFTTDALCSFLQHLIDGAPALAAELIGHLSGGEVSLSSDDVAAVTLETQEHWNLPEGSGAAIPDIVVEGPTLLFLIEVKVGSPVSRGQLEDYLRLLGRDTRQTKKLSLLALTAGDQALPAGVHLVRWFDLSEAIRVLRMKSAFEQAGPVTAYLAEQLEEFLIHQRLALSPARSEISKKIREFEEGIGQVLVFDVRANLARLKSEPELLPLWNLLDLMRQAWLERYPDDTLRYVTGATVGGWFGWSVNGMQYFFTSWYANPEVVNFQLWPPVKQDSWDPSKGKLQYKYGGWRWDQDRDLKNEIAGFFEMTPTDQQAVLGDFIVESRAYADKLERDVAAADKPPPNIEEEIDPT